MWYLIPIIFLVLVVLCWVSVQLTNNGVFSVLGTVFLVVLFVSVFVTPASYFGGIDSKIEAETFYTAIAQPSSIGENDNVLFVSGIVAGLWQSGGYTVVDYNSYLAKNRYWNSKFFIGWCVYPAPDYLKIVEIRSEH